MCNDLKMNEKEFINCLKIHGYISSEEESDCESKPHVDETYATYKPQPIQIDPAIHKIIEIGGKNNTNDGLTKSQRKRKRRKRITAIVKNSSSDITDISDNNIAIDEIGMFDNNNFGGSVFASTSYTTGKSKIKNKGRRNSFSTIQNRIDYEKWKSNKTLIGLSTPNLYNEKLEVDVDTSYQIRQTYADVLKISKPEEVKIPVSVVVSKVRQLYNTEGLTKKEKQALRKRLWRMYQEGVAFENIDQSVSLFWDQENQRPLTLGDFI